MLTETPTPEEMDRAFAAHLRQDRSFREAVGCDPSRLTDEDVVLLHDLMRQMPAPPKGYGRLWTDLMEAP